MENETETPDDPTICFRGGDLECFDAIYEDTGERFIVIQHTQTNGGSMKVAIPIAKAYELAAFVADCVEENPIDPEDEPITQMH